MNNVERYNAIVGKFRQGLNDINSRYDEQIEAKKCYAGSVGFEADIKAIEEKRAAEIAALRENCSEDFDCCIAAMQKAAQSRPITPPTQEQVNILQLLKMKEHVSRDELEHAAHSMRDCSLALSILEEIAGKHDILGFHAGGTCISDNYVNSAIREFAKSARTILSLTRTNQRKEYMNPHGMGDGPNGSIPSMEAIAKFRVDVDVSTPQEAASRFGNIPETAYSAFCEAVSPSTKNT